MRCWRSRRCRRAFRWAAWAWTTRETPRFSLRGSSTLEGSLLRTRAGLGGCKPSPGGVVGTRRCLRHRLRPPPCHARFSLAQAPPGFLEEALIERYTRPEMAAVWSEQRKLETWLQVELAVVEALAEQRVVPDEDAATVRDRAAFTVDAVKERERETDHDVAAFVDVVAASVGDAGRWVHHGLTSSDVLDTALALQLSQAGLLLVGGARNYRDALIRRARQHADTLCVGRTHGVQAEPTTFG